MVNFDEDLDWKVIFCVGIFLLFCAYRCYFAVCVYDVVKVFARSFLYLRAPVSDTVTTKLQ